MSLQTSNWSILNGLLRLGVLHDFLPIELFLHYVRWKSSRMTILEILFIEIRELGLSIGTTVEQPYVTIGIKGYQIGFAWWHDRIQTVKWIIFLSSSQHCIAIQNKPGVLSLDFSKSNCTICWRLKQTTIGRKNHSSRIGIVFVRIDSPKGTSFSFAHQKFFFWSVGRLLRKSWNIELLFQNRVKHIQMFSSG